MKWSKINEMFVNHLFYLLNPLTKTRDVGAYKAAEANDEDAYPRSKAQVHEPSTKE